MSKQINTVSRRNFLKGAVYTSALSIGGLSGAALANTVTPNQFIVSETTSSSVTLMNQTVNTVALDANQPVSLEKVDGWIVVKVNKASEAGSVHKLNLEAGQTLELALDTQMAPMLTNSTEPFVINRTVFVGNDNFPASLYHPTFA